MLLNVAKEFGFKVQTLQHGLEGYKIASEIAQAGTGLSTFADEWSYKIEAYDAIPYNVAILMRHGVVATINSDSDERARRLNIDAAKMMRYGGLTEDEALKTITYNGALQLGVQNKVGSIEVGKDADIAIWSARSAQRLRERRQDVHRRRDLLRQEARPGDARRRWRRSAPRSRRRAPHAPHRALFRWRDDKDDARPYCAPHARRDRRAIAHSPAPRQAQLGSTNPPPGPRGVYAIKNARIVTGERRRHSQRHDRDQRRQDHGGRRERGRAGRRAGRSTARDSTSIPA